MSQYKAGDKAIVLPTNTYMPTFSDNHCGIPFSIVTVEMNRGDTPFPIYCNGRWVYDEGYVDTFSYRPFALDELQPLPIPHSDPEWMLEAE